MRAGPCVLKLTSTRGSCVRPKEYQMTGSAPNSGLSCMSASTSMGQVRNKQFSDCTSSSGSSKTRQMQQHSVSDRARASYSPRSSVLRPPYLLRPLCQAHARLGLHYMGACKGVSRVRFSITQLHPAEHCVHVALPFQGR